MAHSQQQYDIKNTFVHLPSEEEPECPPPPTFSAPDKLQDKSFRLKEAKPVEPAPAPAAPQHHRRVTTVLRRLFHHGAPAPAAGSGPAAAPPVVQQLVQAVPQAPSSPPSMPVRSVHEKNTFIHYDEPRSPSRPPTFSAPGVAVFLGSKNTPPVQQTQSEGQMITRASGATSICSYPSSSIPASSLPSNSSGPVSDQVIVSHAALNRENVGVAASAGAQESLVLSKVIENQRSGQHSLGSEGHGTGQCIPCLMQVRWQAGKCAEPCRFGALCGRCHEAHTEEELQKIQAKMRKLKKKGGAIGAALLSAAYATGQAAPVGGGAGKAPPPAALAAAASAGARAGA